MIISPIKIRTLLPPKDDLVAVLQDAIQEIADRTILVITSKVVSIWQGRCMPKNEAPDRDALIIQEAEKYLPREAVPGGWVIHTVKNNLVVPSAGIDESNANGCYILWPDNPYGAVKDLWNIFRERYAVKDLGIIITDSHSIPQRRGSVGISLAYYGFSPLKDYRGDSDLFGRELQVAMLNVADSLASAAVAVMGEGSESTPVALITDIPFVDFGEGSAEGNKPFSAFEVAMEEDIYYPFFSHVPWREGGIK